MTGPIVLPAILTSAGDDAVTRFAEYFTVHIQNPHTRRAYFRNAVDVPPLVRGPAAIRDLKAIKPMTVAAYIEQLQQTHAKPSIKQHLATIRMLFDWLVIGQVVADQPGPRRPRPQARRHQGHDAGPRRRGDQDAPRQHPHQARAGIEPRARRSRRRI